MLIKTKLIATATLLSFVAACAEDGSGNTPNIARDIQTIAGGTAGKSPAQAELAQRQRDYATVRVTASLGAAAGALLACQIRGCTNEERNAAVLAAGFVGYVSGSYLVGRNAQFQATQETLQRDISSAKEDNKRLSASVTSAQRVLSFQKSEVARLNQEFRAGTVSRDAYAASYAGLQEDLTATKALRGTSEQRLSGLNGSINQHASAGLPTGQLVTERNAQQEKIKRLRAVEQGMINVLGSVPSEVRRAG